MLFLVLYQTYFEQNRTYLVSTTTRRLACARGLIGFQDIIGHIIKIKCFCRTKIRRKRPPVAVFKRAIMWSIKPNQVDIKQYDSIFNFLKKTSRETDSKGRGRVAVLDTSSHGRDVSSSSLSQCNHVLRKVT